MASGSSKRRKRRAKRAAEGNAIATASTGKGNEGFFDASEALEQEEDEAVIREQIRAYVQRRHDLPDDHPLLTPGAKEYIIGNWLKCYMYECSKQKVSVEEYFRRRDS